MAASIHSSIKHADDLNPCRGHGVT